MNLCLVLLAAAALAGLPSAVAAGTNSIKYEIDGKHKQGMDFHFANPPSAY